MREGTDVRCEVRPNHLKKNLSRKDIVYIPQLSMTFMHHSRHLKAKMAEMIKKSRQITKRSPIYIWQMPFVILTQHGHDPTNMVFSDENESPVEHPENLGFKNQERAEWTKHRTEIQNGVCFSFRKKELA